MPETFTKRAIPQSTRRAVVLRLYPEAPEHGMLVCVYCGDAGSFYWPRRDDGRPGGWVHFSDLELDHRIPESLGGSSAPENIVTACPPCNRRKGAQIW